MKNKNALRGGMYSLAATAIVLAILVVLNIFVSVLPDNLTKLDISSQKLYSVTSNTKAVVNALLMYFRHLRHNIQMIPLLTTVLSLNAVTAAVI